MTVVLSGSDRRTRLGLVVLDVLTTEEIDFDAQVTLYPVEDGSEISDHITHGNERLKLSGLIATADVAGGSGIASAFGFSADNSIKLVDVIEALRRMHTERQLVTISTGQLVYEGFAFTNLNASRTSDGDGGNWLSIRADLIKIRKVNLKTADVPPPENVSGSASGRAGETGRAAGKSTPSGNTGASAGATPAATPAQTNNTVAYDISKGTPGTIGGRIGGAIRSLGGS